jgi:N-acetylmuramoyl-L-alanine amidase
MVKTRFIVINIRSIFLFVAILFIVSSLVFILFKQISNHPANKFIDPHSGIIVVDPGHGGIDGGTSRNGVLEKNINLDISNKLKFHLEQKGYKIVMTRLEDVSLDELSSKGVSRHHRDLNARVNIINNSNAQLFLSIHGNCQSKNCNADGSLVIYNNKFTQNKSLACFIQRSLNNMVVNGRNRTTRDPQSGSFFILNNSNIPGVIVETAFLTNSTEFKLLMEDGFRDDIAKAIAEAVENYLDEQKKV